MKGKIALHGNKAKRDWSKRVQKTQRKRLSRFCIDCGKSIIYQHGLSIRCGNERRKTGCAYKAYVERHKRWKKKVDYDHRPNRREKLRKYWNAYDSKRKDRKRLVKKS